MPSLKQMKAAISAMRRKNGEKPLPKHRCCNSAVSGRHTRTCPNHPENHCRPGEDGGDIAEFLRDIQGHPKGKRS